MNTFQVKLLTPTAQMPTRGSKLAAGLDIYADLLDENGKPRVLRTGKNRSLDVVQGDYEDGSKWGFVLTSGKRVLIPTGFAMAASPDIYARVAPRSGLALNHGIDVLAGVVDVDFRGEVAVMVLNTDHEDVIITHGMRIAQIVLERVSLQLPTKVDTLPGPGDRDPAGYGTTGAH
jgi:dUTP pyrophosphatase